MKARNGALGVPVLAYRAKDGHGDLEVARDVGFAVLRVGDHEPRARKLVVRLLVDQAHVQLRKAEIKRPGRRRTRVRESKMPGPHAIALAAPYRERADARIALEAAGVEDLEGDEFLKELGRRFDKLEDHVLVKVRVVGRLLHARLLALAVHCDFDCSSNRSRERSRSASVGSRDRAGLGNASGTHRQGQ